MNRARTRRIPQLYRVEAGPPRQDAGALGGYAKANLKRPVTPEEASAQLSTNHAGDDRQRFG
jgi:hypothetical protein